MFDNYTKYNDEDRDRDEYGDKYEDERKEYVKDEGHEAFSFINGASSGSLSPPFSFLLLLLLVLVLVLVVLLSQIKASEDF